MAGMDRGSFTVKNPFSGRPYTVDARPENVHTIVFWSKDFGRFLEGDYGPALQRRGCHLFFNFTVNSESMVLEPNIAPLDQRLEQARDLCRHFGPETVQWRFDPICFYRHGSGIENNLHGFETIASRLAEMGVRRCVTSFVDIYAKVARRVAPVDGFEWIDPPVEKKIRVLTWMQRVLARLGMKLYTCCEKDVMAAMPPDSGIMPAACIPNDYLAALFGGRVSFQKDSGQRGQKGCGCMASRDIGGYADQPCFHDCLYCYARPEPSTRLKAEHGTGSKL